MSTPATELKPGDKQRDGTVYAGISPDTGKPMYTTPADAPLTMTFNEAADYAKKLNRENFLGHDDWRVPAKPELDVLFNNRAAIGGFDDLGGSQDFWHWSASPYDERRAWVQSFIGGYQEDANKADRKSVRLVRDDGPKP